MVRLRFPVCVERPACPRTQRSQRPAVRWRRDPLRAHCWLSTCLVWRRGAPSGVLPPLLRCRRRERGRPTRLTRSWPLHAGKASTRSSDSERQLSWRGLGPYDARPLSVCSETRFSPSFLRTTPARKPRTECCCHSVTAMIAAIVAPSGFLSIAMTRACLVSGLATGLDDAGTDRLRDTGSVVFRAVERVAAFGLDLGLVRGDPPTFVPPHPPHHPSPARVIHPAGLDPAARLS